MATLRWTLSDDTHTASIPGGAWNGEDLDVGTVTHRLRHDHSGWQARYWGHSESRRYHTGTGADPAVIGELWATVDLAKAAVEEAHQGVASCDTDIS